MHQYKISDVRKTLDSQYEDIVTLRTQMLNEYEQLLSVRTDIMASQTEEVEKLQEEMVSIQRQYEEQMSTFQTKVEEQTGKQFFVYGLKKVNVRKIRTPENLL